MATSKFKGTSPYVKPTPPPHPSDYLHKGYVNDLALKSDKGDDPVINVALFGVGRAGTIHLASIRGNPRVKLLYIVDENEHKFAQMKKYWHLDGGVTIMTSKQSDRVFKDPNVHAVVVASPTYAHENIVTKALDARKAVFCEKPIAENPANTLKCYDASAKVGKVLFSAFNRRFDPSYSALRDRVRKGEVGHVHTIRVTARDSPLPTIDYLANSGGIFHDCMVHDIDMMTWILGEYPIKVTANATANIPEIQAIDDFDTVVATLQFPSGTLGMIDISRNSSYGYDQRLEVFGPKGMIRADNEQPIHCVETMYDMNGPNTAPIWYSFPSRFMRAYRAEFEHFLDVTLGKCESMVKPKETMAVTKIASAIEAAVRTSKVVDIKWANGELPPQQ